MNSMKYYEILNLNLAAPASKLKLGRRWIFQQNNDPKQTSKSTQKWLTEDKIKPLIAISVPWPKPVGWAEEESAQERSTDPGWFKEIMWRGKVSHSFLCILYVV